MKKAEYKFDANLLKLSRSKDIAIAKTEWRTICKEEREERDGLCICQHTLKNIIYMYNIFTKKTISVGTRCCKKFNLNTSGIDNNILKNVLSIMIRAGEYKIIDNILQYTADIQSQMIKYIMDEYTYFYNENLLMNIKMLIDKYKLSYLQSVYDELISRKEKEREEREESIRKTNEKIEKERKERKEEKEETEKLKIYCVETHYTIGDGTDIFVDKYKFLTKQECKDFISRLPKIGVTVYSSAKTIKSINILLNDELIKHYENLPKTPALKSSAWKKKYAADGKVYWYDHKTRASVYLDPCKI